MRTTEEIVARIETQGRGIFGGFSTEVLITALPFEAAKERGMLKEGATDDHWAEVYVHDADGIKAAAIDYLKFAFDKALDHRGLSANRSVTKMEEFLWLLDDDEALRRFLGTPYPMYGAPQLAEAAVILGVSMPDSEAFARMATGRSCKPGCDEGCGR